MAFYSFQLSGVHCLEPRSRRTDISLISFGVLVNKREYGRGTAFVPFRKGTQLRGKELTEAARANGYPVRAHYMKPNWEIGPIQVDSGDSVELVLTATNTSDSQLPSADSQKIDEWTIKALNIYYSWLLGDFVSAFGLSELGDIVSGSGVLSDFLADPVGKLLGYEKSGPCNGVVFRDALQYDSNELNSFEFGRAESPLQGVSLPMQFDLATTHHSYTGSDAHNADGCGPVARNEVEVTIRRFPYWSWEHFLWDYQASARGRFTQGGSVKEILGIRF